MIMCHESFMLGNDVSSPNVASENSLDIMLILTFKLIIILTSVGRVESVLHVTWILLWRTCGMCNMWYTPLYYIVCNQVNWYSKDLENNIFHHLIDDDKWQEHHKHSMHSPSIFIGRNKDRHGSWCYFIILIVQRNLKDNATDLLCFPNGKRFGQ